MAKGEMQEHIVVEQLNKKADLKVDFNKRIIQHIQGPRAKGDVGIKSKGKLDFLTTHKGYVLDFVDKFDNQ
jgi:hypothetical protein